MKRIYTLLFAFVMVCGFTVSARATLIDNLDGTVTDNDEYGIMLLQVANYAATNTFDVSGININGKMTWNTANLWIQAMNDANHKGYSDWRLPTALNLAGEDTWPVGMLGELGHIRHDELGNIEGSPITQLAPFIITPTGDPTQEFWTSTPFTLVAGSHFTIRMWNGELNAQGETNILDVWAVRDVTAVPEPATIALLGIGLAGLAGATVRRRRKRNAKP